MDDIISNEVFVYTMIVVEQFHGHHDIIRQGLEGLREYDNRPQQLDGRLLGLRL